jgi:hypothetical protein
MEWITLRKWEALPILFCEEDFAYCDGEAMLFLQPRGRKNLVLEEQ